MIGLPCATSAMAHEPNPNKLGNGHRAPFAGSHVVHGRVREAYFASAESAANASHASCPSQLASCPAGEGIQSPECCASALPHPSASCCESDYPVCCGGSPSYCCPSSHPICLGDVKCGAQVSLPSIPQSRQCICNCAFQFGCMGACSPCDKDCCDRCCQNSYGCDSGNCEAAKHRHVKKLITRLKVSEAQQIVGQTEFVGQANHAVDASLKFDSVKVDQIHEARYSNTAHASVPLPAEVGGEATIKHGQRKAKSHSHRVEVDNTSAQNENSNSLQLDPSCAPYSAYVQCPSGYGWQNGTVRHHDCCGSQQYFCPTGYGLCSPNDGCCPDGYAIDCGDYCCPSGLPYCLGGMQCSNLGTNVGLNTLPSIGSCPHSSLSKPSETEVLSVQISSTPVQSLNPSVDAAQGQCSTCIWAGKTFTTGACFEDGTSYWRCCGSGQWSGPSEGICPNNC